MYACVYYTERGGGEEKEIKQYWVSGIDACVSM